MITIDVAVKGPLGKLIFGVLLVILVRTVRDVADSKLRQSQTKLSSELGRRIVVFFEVDLDETDLRAGFFFCEVDLVKVNLSKYGTLRATSANFRPV